MRKNIAEKIFPEIFKYWSTEWYISMKEDREKYQYRILVTVFTIGTLIPLLLMIDDLLKRDYLLMKNYIIPSLTLGFFLTYVVKTKNTQKGTTLALLTVIIGFILCLVLPKGNPMYFILFSAFPVLVFQIKGMEKGLWWSKLTFLLGLICFTLVKLKLITTWSNELATLEILLVLVVYVLLFILSYVGEKQHEYYLVKFIKRINFDYITELPNRVVLLKSIDSYKEDFFIILRILNFNDLISLFGYELSDAIISFAGRQVKNLKSEFKIDAFKLLSSDFGIMFLENTNCKSDLQLRLRKMLNRLESKTMKWEDKDINLIYGFGVCKVGEQSFDKILSNADRALKEGLDNNLRLSFYNDSAFEQKRCLDSMLKFSRLIEGKNSKNLLAVFQPIVNTNSEEIEWYEALVRVKNGDKFESVYSYLDIAKSTGIYPYISEFILESACKFINMTGCGVSINISVIDILNPNFYKLLEELAFKKYKCSSKLILEIVETEDMLDHSKIIKFINKAKDLGIKTAMDDFGSGYSNLVNIINLPFDIIKIDGELIKDINTDFSAFAMLESIVLYCKTTGKKIVAEYVETKEILNKVRELEIDYSQGYFFAKPSDLNSILELSTEEEFLMERS